MYLNSVIKMCFLFIIMIVIIGSYKNTIMGVEMGFCQENVTMTFETECQSCLINFFVDCPSSAEKLTKKEGTPGCTYEMHLGPGPNVTKEGCTHTCNKTVMVDQCCKGFWGPNCDECPGGYLSACNGHGTCSDLINGTGQCTCESGWTGYACEFCANSSVGGENCTQVSVSKNVCVNVTCPNNSKCVEVDEEAECMCNWPYVEHNTNSSDNSSLVCKELDVCTLPPLCHMNASCTRSDMADITGLEKNCTCGSGFHGDGYQCDPTDPCQVNNGGCDLDTSICNFITVGQSECMCKDGYHKHVLDQGCSLIDICALNTSACHPKAVCKTVAPYEVSCTCNDGYEGDGQVCFANILQTLKDLDESDPDLKGQMTLIQGAIEKYYTSELTQHAFFTMFVPTNEGFRTINTADYQKWLNNKVRVRQILRQHIIVGLLTTEKLVNQTVFHTLQGTPAELLVTWKGEFKFRLFGSSKKSKLVRGNIKASNGIIHIINKLMTNSPDNHGEEEKTIYENIRQDGKYNRFQTLVESVGTDIKDILMSQNVTVLAPNNGAFDALPIGALDFLTSSEGKGHLLGLLKNHIFEHVLEITDLMNTRRITSLAKISNLVYVTRTGQFQLGNGINITQADITASNGLIHDIDGVLIARDISILPNKCDLYSYKEVMGPCGDCRSERRCFKPDVELNTTVECQYYTATPHIFSRYFHESRLGWPAHRIGHSRFFSDHRYVRRTGCAPLCNRTYTIAKCCEGFYGFDCMPCPGGHKYPCNGRGKCIEGYFGNGTCQCDSQFGGDACDTCADDKHFGPNCTQECTCVHGFCNSGLQGDGKCKQPCFMPMIGENCDIQASVCNAELHHCHVHAVCIWVEKNLDFRCICLPGYSGNGLTCTEIDPCVEPERGGCHLQATCVKTAPGVANCTCNEGWFGDGKHCHMETTCSEHTECHRYASCLPTTPGKHICQCKDDFIGNGTYCLYKDRCEVNNGGCHPVAKCSHDDRSEIYVNCTCPIELGYSGNGFSCYGNLIIEIESHPKLKYVAKLLQSMSSANLQLFLDNNYTVFVPSDKGFSEFNNNPSHKITHWIKPENMITLLDYHTILGSYRLEQLVAISEIKKIETMADGFSVYVTKGKDGTVRLLPQRTGTVAKVIDSDIIATNGYINVIDKVLEPYMPTLPEDYPDLETFFTNHSEYSIFAGWLQEKNLTYKLENIMDKYTLFVPNNEAAKSINRTVTTNYLRYYIVPKISMMASVDDGKVIVTDLGKDHQLVLNSIEWNKYTVNHVAIVKADMFTYGGMVNEIDGLLHPVLHECDEKNITVGFGVCTVCKGPGTLYPCYGNSESLPSEEPLDCMYTEREIFGGVIQKKGCQGVCATQTLIKGCCAGYFGKECQECPSGPEFPCSGHGTCNDGIQGDGSCQCDTRFTGDHCDTCVEGWAGVNCDIDKTSCSYRNGGCHKHADCHQGNTGEISCKCWDGFEGDGYNCSGLCDVANGGCHSSAICQYKNKDIIQCRCKGNLVGDGRTYCMGDILSFLHVLPHTKWFLKSLQQVSNETLLGNLRSSFSTDSFTVFVPVDKSLKNMMPESSVLQQIVVSNDPNQLTSLSPVDFSNITLKTLANQTVVMSFNRTDQSFYVNGSRILSGNIEFTNGIVHVVEHPFTPITLEQSMSQRSFPFGAALGPLAGLTVIVLVVVVVVLYHRSQNGYWKVLQKWVSRRKDSDVTSHEALHVDDDDDDANTVSGLPERDNSFGNPLYKSEDL